MALTPDEVAHVAELARLHLTPGDRDRLGGHLSKILGYIEKLNELDTEGVEISHHVLGLTNAFRADTPRPPLDVESMLVNAPEHDNRCIVVPRVVGGEDN